ncbi:MAG TPA: PEP-utilizing enzyme [Candidatus Polarisedimenticolaceae bacterium]|nr:PEP-utilizing enzyme [Candidatus Polarisedimenticolaceae bacterium]
MSATRPAPLHLEPPAPGFWELDPVHFPRPATRYWAEMHPEPFKRGTSEFARGYGMLIDGIEMSYVQGFAYKTVRPVPAGEIPQRFARAAEVLEQKYWNEQLRDWDQTFKPAAVKAHRAIQAVDPDALSDTALAEHLVRCRDHHVQMIYQHMRFTAAAIVPVGDFLAHVGDWTGLPPSELLGLMRGTSPVSAGASAELAGMIAAIRKDPTAQTLLASEEDAGKTLEALRALDGGTGTAVSGYLDVVGYRLLDGFDISNPTALELPHALLRAIRGAMEERADHTTDVEARIAEVRARVPEPHRSAFDALVDEARGMYRIRDERGVFSDIWASGLMRRAALAAGRRVAAKGRIHEPAHFVDAGIEEMKALLLSTGGPSADELAERARYRAAHTAKDVPLTLGPPPPPPPDLAGLPPHVQRLMRATMVALGALFGSSDAQHDQDKLRGLAASRGVYEGPARRVNGPTEFGRIVKGDVLVTQSTTEAFNILLPLLGGIVTDSGGLLSHAAIVAREYGIPGVVGTREATDRIPDGVRVRVDGNKGEVTVLG